MKYFKFDDWFMGVFVTAAYTILLVITNKWLKARSNLEPPGFDFAALSDHELAYRRYGSKLMVGVEQLLVTVIWSCKACLLIMYYSITRLALRNENRAIKYLAIYAATSFVLMEALYFGVWCRPFSKYYAVPTNSQQCDTLVDHRIMKAVFNISSDVVMLTIALQMLMRSLLPMKRKLVLFAIFSVGIFVVIASIASTYYSLRYPYRDEWLSWYVREASTAVIVANLPFTWTVLKNLFELDDFHANTPAPWTYHSAGRKTSMATNPGTRNSITTAGSRAGSKYKKSSYSTFQSTGTNSVVITGGSRSWDSYVYSNYTHVNTIRYPGMTPVGSVSDEKALLDEEMLVESPRPILNTPITDVEHGFPELSHFRFPNEDNYSDAFSYRRQSVREPSPVHIPRSNEGVHAL